ncbi:MAG: apiosidase-like domain-containing protein [Saccharofermentanales bacterium]
MENTKPEIEYTIAKWMMYELSFTSSQDYENPFYDAELTAEFTGPEGQILTRPGFWYGKSEWKVRVALTQEGLWKYKTSCTDRCNKGLHGLEGEIGCIKYTGHLDIYKHGFIRVSDDNRHFAYDDGTPFFYLGDTHWFLPHEKTDRSGVEGIPSQFHYMVDSRVSQGFTVFQSEPLFFANYPFVYNLNDGLDQKDADGFALLDKKFEYIAQQGLVHANAELFFVLEINNRAYTPEYLVKLAKFWVARYGAFPVLWTIAQESDPDCYGQVPPHKWFTVAETIVNNDAYKHPLTSHMCGNKNYFSEKTTAWGDKYYHSWFSVQPGDMVTTQYYRDMWEYKNTKPFVIYETGYENLWNDKNGALGAGYKAFQFGNCGYGYGAHGVWNDNYDRSDWMDYGGYHRWFEGLNLPGGARLPLMKKFYNEIPWWEQQPRFDNPEWSDFGANSQKILATIGQRTYTAYFFNNNTSTGTIKNLLTEETYTAWWYDIDSGEYALIETFNPISGTYAIPERPDPQPRALLVSCDEKINKREQTPLFITSENLQTTIWTKGGSMKLFATHPAEWSLTDLQTGEPAPDMAEISSEGVLTAKGKNGIILIRAEDANGSVVYKTIILLRQDTTNPPAKTGKLEVAGNKDTSVITAKVNRLQVMPVFTPPDTHDQRVEWALTDIDGNPTPLAFLGEHGMLHAIADGQVMMTATAQDGTGIKGSAIFTIEGHGEPSLAAYAEVMTSDFVEDYGARTDPKRAINGVIEDFSGWCSRDHASYESPVWLQLDMKSPKSFNHIDLYTTAHGYLLKDFDVQAMTDDGWQTLFSVKDNDTRLQSRNFDSVTSSKIRVICYKGDMNGNARVDQINVYDIKN